MIARTWSRACSRPWLVSTTKWARARFSVSCIWLARMASSRAASCRAGPAPVRAGHASGRGDHHHGVHRAPRRRSRTASGCRAPRSRRPRRSARLEKGRRGRRRAADGRSPFSRFSASGSLNTMRAERRAVDHARPDHAWKGRSIGLDRRAARRVEPVHLGVGVVDRRALLGEHGRGGRLAHADRAGEADGDHAGPPERLQARRAHVDSAGGGRPNKASNDGRAWPISISRPSTMAKPAARRGREQGGLQRPIDHVHHHRIPRAGRRATGRAARRPPGRAWSR